MAERRVVDLEDRAAVVAEVAQQAEVDPDPVRDAPRSASASKVSCSRAVARSTAAPPRLAGLLQHLAAAAQLGEGDAGRALLLADPLQGGELRLEADQVVRRQPAEDRRPAPPPRPRTRRGAGGKGRRRRARSRRGLSPAASSAASSTSTTSAVPCGAGAPISSTPA